MSEHPASSILRALPSVDAVLRTEEARVLHERTGAQRLTTFARHVMDQMRAELQLRYSDESHDNGPLTREALLAEAARRLERAVADEESSSLRHVINATGVMLHTNLGRAPLSEAARHAVAREAARYCTLEYDTQTGARGRRGGRVEALLCELTGAEAALVVNNGAAAALLALTALAGDGETIISRGELVEIGGDFRVPEVLAQSGTQMVEVGATNRTRLADYECAINARTRLILRVHPSNYRIVGFTAAPALAELAALAHDTGHILFEDAGSGALFDLSPYGLTGEPVIRDSIASGVDLVSFSGDKLLGAAQAGLIVGRRELVERLRRHPLSRAMRADKLALAALEATLDSYRRGTATTDIPTLRMLAASRAAIEKRTRAFARRLRARLASSSGALQFNLLAGASAIGGGSAPTIHPPTVLLAFTHAHLSTGALEETLRLSNPPIIARIHEGRVVVDLRAVMEDEEADLLKALASL